MCTERSEKKGREREERREEEKAAMGEERVETGVRGEKSDSEGEKLTL